MTAYGIKFNDKEMQKSIVSALAITVEKQISRATPRIQRRIKELVRQAVEYSPEWQSLKPGGFLYGELGLSPTVTLNEILDVIVDSCEVEIVRHAKPRARHEGVTMEIQMVATAAARLPGPRRLPKVTD